MKNKKIRYLLFLPACMVILCSVPKVVYCADIHYDKDQYNVVIREDFYIGLNIDEEEDEDIDEFNVKLKYDENMLEYVQGGTSGGDGEVIINHTTAVKNVRNLIIFRSLAGGETSVVIEKAAAVNKNGKKIKSIARSKVPVHIRLDRNALIDSLSINGTLLEDFNPQDSVYKLQVPNEVSELDLDADLNRESASLTVSKTKLNVGKNTIYLTVRGSNGPNVYTLHVNRAKPPAGQKNLQQEQETEDARGILFLMAGITFVMLAISSFLMLLAKKRQRNRKRTARQEMMKNYSGPVQARRSGRPIAGRSCDTGEKPVISVRNVSMHFKVSTQNVSGLKEFAVQKIKGKIKYRDLKALDHVSFDVFPGEVVGIIGTNGSGKSTLLKIVSGALRPTSGRVVVDRSKIQLLTLGTGFDMELTARENVYLNGAIIGYSRKFIDRKYNDIVKFAELEGFMDEKVKNFSSGMVSRLGFAIATIEDAPEILILDEVLSVGDEFFRKKSLARIKEMIHGGSTVLLVSHSMSTIKDNCSKVVWIEKGKLRMVGAPGQVCETYHRQNEKKNEITEKTTGER